jgi:hypothetical protein
LAEKAEVPRIEISPKIRKNICVELEEVKHQARQEERQARDEWQQLMKRRDRVINLKDSRTYTFHHLDRYQLPIFRKYKISPALAEELNCDEILHKPLTRLDIAVSTLIGIAQFAVIGGLICAAAIVYRRTKSIASKSPVNRQVLWRTLVFGTLMSIVVIAIGVAVVTEDLIFILWFGGQLWMLKVLIGFLGFSVVGSYLLALRIARKKINQQRLTEGEHSKNGRT